MNLEDYKATPGLTSDLSAVSVDDRGLTAQVMRTRKFAAHRHTFYAFAPFFHHSGFS